MLTFEYISDDASLLSLVEQYQHSALLVLDTEFVRTRTYYAKLGLIQAYDGKTLALIDPVAIKDLSPFWQLLTDPNIVKLVHSCSEDLEVFAHYGECQPSPLFDSQIAASFAGLGHGLGYAKLVDACLQVEIDKGESRTDWMNRPLSDSQLQYAANDVFYLYKLFRLKNDDFSKRQFVILLNSNKIEWKKDYHCFWNSKNALNQQIIHLLLISKFRFHSSNKLIRILFVKGICFELIKFLSHYNQN